MVLFDQQIHASLYPFTYTRSVADIRMGILTMQQRWELLSGRSLLISTLPHLQALYPPVPHSDNLFVDAAVLPTRELSGRILSIQKGEGLYEGTELIACRYESASLPHEAALTKVAYTGVALKRLQYPWHIFQYNGEMLRLDFELLTAGRSSASLSPGNQVMHPEQIFVEEGAVVSHSLLNATDGPIYIGKNAQVMEGCCIRGPFSAGEGAVVKMGSKVYGSTTIGPNCIAGGEIKNSVLFGNSNKAHDGYLGDSVVGEWCNFGAGTSNSNLKNTGGEIKMWVAGEQQWVAVGNKCGVLMGDYSRTAINTAINTGTIIGICCNVFGEGFTPHVLPNFTWGITGLTRYQLDKALRDVANWKNFKQQPLTDADAAVLKHIFETVSIPTPW